MGTALVDTKMPLLKQNNAVLVLGRKDAERLTENPCIRCGRCANTCPMALQPLLRVLICSAALQIHQVEFYLSD